MIVYNKDKNKILNEEEYDLSKGYLDYEELNGERVIVYYPFDEEQLLEQQLEELRQRREQECFTIINRGALWYDNLSGVQLEELEEWYRKWLMAPQTLEVPNKPEWIK